VRWENEVSVDVLLSWQHSCQKLSKSVDVLYAEVIASQLTVSFFETVLKSLTLPSTNIPKAIQNIKNGVALG